MLEKTNVKTLDKVVVRFSGDSGDGMQLAGNIFTNVSAGLGNSVSTFPDYPADMRPPQGSLSGVSAFQASVGKGVHTPGDQCDVLVAMNPAALKRAFERTVEKPAYKSEGKDVAALEYRFHIHFAVGESCLCHGSDGSFDHLGVDAEFLERIFGLEQCFL